MKSIAEQIREKVDLKTDKDGQDYITETELMMLIGDCLSETVDYEILTSGDEKDKEWFERVNNIVKYMLYNYFGIEVR